VYAAYDVDISGFAGSDTEENCTSFFWKRFVRYSFAEYAISKQC
jgi:hypothetical protein